MASVSKNLDPKPQDQSSMQYARRLEAETDRLPRHARGPALKGTNASRGQSPRKRDGLKVSGSAQ